jgi:hypothetical protein
MLQPKFGVVTTIPLPAIFGVLNASVKPDKSEINAMHLHKRCAQLHVGHIL